MPERPETDFGNLPSTSDWKSGSSGRIVHVHPKKKLGQHFLRWKEVGEKIVASLGATQEHTVIEIGAGTGELTRIILKYAGLVVAVEVDETCFPTLKLLEGLNKNLQLFFGDIRNLNLSSFQNVLILGNLPYHLSGDILFWLLEQRDFWRKAILTVQAEFAERLSAQTGSHDYSALSVVAQTFLTVRELFEIDPKAFVPQPKVRSITIEIAPLSSPAWKKDPSSFSKKVRVCFTHRRKTLLNNLRMAKIETPERIMQSLGLGEKIRPQELSPDDYVKLVDYIS